MFHDFGVISWSLLSDVSSLEHIPTPLCSHLQSSTFTLSLCSTRFLVPPPPFTHACSCILHLHHHIRPVLFLHSDLIYIPPSPPHALPPSSLPPCCLSPVFHDVWVTLGSYKKIHSVLGFVVSLISSIILSTSTWTTVLHRHGRFC